MIPTPEDLPAELLAHAARIQVLSGPKVVM